MLGESANSKSRIQVESADGKIVKEILQGGSEMPDCEDRGVKLRYMPKKWLNPSLEKEADMIARMKQLTKLAGTVPLMYCLD